MPTASWLCPTAVVIKVSLHIGMFSFCNIVLYMFIQTPFMYYRMKYFALHVHNLRMTASFIYSVFCFYCLKRTASFIILVTITSGQLYPKQNISIFHKYLYGLMNKPLIRQHTYCLNKL